MSLVQLVQEEGGALRSDGAARVGAPADGGGGSEEEDARWGAASASS